MCPFSMLSAAPQVSERSTGPLSKLRNPNEASRLTPDVFGTTVFRYVLLFILRVGVKKGGLDLEGKGPLSYPPSTYTSLHYCHSSNDASLSVEAGPPQWRRVC